jgi:ubiquinone/menaquinone biosynthesis C-methylase UbiE
MILADRNSNSRINTGWHPCWEENVYKFDRQLNMYPYDSVVSFIYKNYSGVCDRSNIEVLELGFGAGNNLWFMAREGFSVAGIEGSKSAFDFAKNRFQSDGLNGDLRSGDFSELPWDDNSFDAVIDRGALTCNSHETIKLALKESQRVLKKSGLLLSVLLFSDLHPERKYGEKVAKNTYDKFKKGYFKDLGSTHFAPFAEIMELYGKIFKIKNLTHTLEENYLVNPKETVSAYWKIECENK